MQANSSRRIHSGIARLRYVNESYTKNLPVANIAEAMGHTMEVHLKNYGRFKPSGTGNLYAEVNV